MSAIVTLPDSRRVLVAGDGASVSIFLGPFLARFESFCVRCDTAPIHFRFSIEADNATQNDPDFPAGYIAKLRHNQKAWLHCIAGAGYGDGHDVIIWPYTESKTSWDHPTRPA